MKARVGLICEDCSGALKRPIYMGKNYLKCPCGKIYEIIVLSEERDRK